MEYSPLPASWTSAAPNTDLCIIDQTFISILKLELLKLKINIQWMTEFLSYLLTLAFVTLCWESNHAKALVFDSFHIYSMIKYEFFTLNICLVTKCIKRLFKW